MRFASGPARLAGAGRPPVPAYWPLLLALAVFVVAPRAWAQPEAAAAPHPCAPPSDRDGPAVPGAGRELESADIALLRLEGQERVAALAGQPIAAVSVETVGARWTEYRPAIQSVKVGEPLTGEAARRALRETLDTGRFADAVVDARPFGDEGVILRVLAQPRRIIADVRIAEGPLDQAATLAAASLGRDVELTEARLFRAERAIARFYAEHGYDEPAITTTTQDTDDPTRVVLLISLAGAAARSVDRRIFVIEPMFDAVLPPARKRQYEVASGDRPDEERLIRADEALGERLRLDGFLRAAVSHRVVERQVPGERAPRWDLCVFLDPGPAYRFRFEGNAAFDRGELESALDLEKRPSSDARELADRLTSHYRVRGFMDAAVETTVVGGSQDPEHEITFRIEEGFPVRVRQRVFACLPEPATEEGLAADDLGEEIDSILEDVLPDLSFIQAVDEALVDDVLTSGQTRGGRAPPRRLAPAMTYTPAAYERAIEHLQNLLQSKGYLNARVGPVSLIRATCDPNAREGVCDPLPLPALPAPQCRRDVLGLPLPEPPLGPEHTCDAGPKKEVTCSPSMSVYLPVQLGPRTKLYDLVFEGNATVASTRLQEIAAFELGADFSNLELDKARRRILDDYRNRGYAYADVRADVELSPDRTRARARFVVNEHKPVIIRGYEVRGNVRTNEALIMGRLTLCRDLEACPPEERYFFADRARESEDNIARLGTFASVSIALDDPETPEETKEVIITVTEQRSQYIEVGPGFSTGAGFRVAFEYGNRNVVGEAIALTVRLELTVLPDILIIDRDVARNYEELQLSERIERRNTVSLRFPEIGLGPKVDLIVNGIDLRDNQRDFGLTREALVPVLGYRPTKDLRFELGASVEVNDVQLFGAEEGEAAIEQNPALANLLRVPSGRTIAVSQSLNGTWDRRDNPLAATTGTLFTAGVEHVSAFPLDDDTEFTSEFLRFTARAAGYVRLTKKGMALAMSLASGYNLQLRDDSRTYPDRLFYLGGVNTLRGFQLDSLVPQDIAQQLLDGEIASIDNVGVRGGDFALNPRVELRVPVTDLWGFGVFVDTGNVWVDAGSIESVLELFELRPTTGAGLRINTPIGPIALDLGFNIVRRDWEDLAAIHFSIGVF